MAKELKTVTLGLGAKRRAMSEIQMGKGWYEGCVIRTGTCVLWTEEALCVGLVAGHSAVVWAKEVMKKKCPVESCVGRGPGGRW